MDKIHHKHQERSNCVCGVECLSCTSGRLTVTCGSDIEAKQYEYNLDNKLKHKEHQMKAAHAGTDVKHDFKKMSHKDHESAMSSPEMAQEMEQDMKKRFWWSFVLSIPIILYSPLGVNIFKISLPSPIPFNWLLLILTTPVVFWAGSIFIVGAFYSLKNKKLNMSVLISVGVLAAFIFSVLITLFIGGETFYEAAAMLVTFVLFGHWMEMKSRKGTSDSLRALFDLVPPQATVIRGQGEVTIPTSEIQLNDIVIVKPGDKIPVDGEILEGSTSIDEALVTGESMPVDNEEG